MIVIIYLCMNVFICLFVKIRIVLWIYTFFHSFCWELFISDLTLKKDFCWCLLVGFLFTQNCSQISPHSILCRIIYPFIEYLYIGAYKRTMYQYINVILPLPNLMKNALIFFKSKIRLGFHRSYSLLDLIVTNKFILKLFFCVYEQLYEIFTFLGEHGGIAQVHAENGEIIAEVCESYEY